MLTANDSSLSAIDSVISTPVIEPSGIQLRGLVQQVLWNLQSSRTSVERRRSQRHAYPYPLRIWPGHVCRTSLAGILETVGEGTVVMGKHLSAGGLDFYTREPMADRRVVVSLDGGDGQLVKVLTELTWCRFGGHGMYINGGRFVRTISSANQVMSG